MGADFLPKLGECPVCGDRRLAQALSIRYWREYLLPFDECVGCGLVFANPMPSDGVIAQGNAALVKHYSMGRTWEHEFRDARQAFLRGKILGKKLAAWKRPGQPPGRMLEIGCYQGFLSLGVRETSGWTVEGVEIAQDLADFVNQKLGIRCHASTLEAAQLPSGSFDYIVCHDLIEHVNQPTRFLSELSRILAPGGRIQIVTPNAIQDLAYARRAAAAQMPITMLLNHIMMFSPRALGFALKKAGLRPLKLYCYDVRHVLKDMGWLGRGRVSMQGVGLDEPPSIAKLLEEKVPSSLLSEWTPARLAELRSHRKVSRFYGWIREELPAALRLRVPARVGLGHEIYALAGREE